MSHPGDRLSALVDGELGHDERDRMLTHLARCPECRAEAAALRALKRRVAALGDAAMDARLLGRLLALAAHGRTVPPLPVPGSPLPRPALRMYQDHRPYPYPYPYPYPDPRRPAGLPGGPAGPGRDHLARQPGRARPPGRSAGRASRRRGAYVVASVLSVLVVSIGGLSFVEGGAQGIPTPHVTPAVDVFTMQHSVTTGELPIANLISSPATGGAPAGGARHGQP